MHSQGRKFKPSAKKFNELDRVARDARAKSQSFLPAEAESQQLYRWVYAKNNSADAKGRGEPVAISTSVGVATDVDFSITQSGLYSFTHVQLGDTSRLRLAIALESIDAGKVGRVAIDGIVFAKTKLHTGVVGSNVGWVHPYLSSDANYKSFLRVGEWGYAKIICEVAGLGSLIKLNDRQLNVYYQLTRAWSDPAGPQGNIGSPATPVIGPVNLVDNYTLVAEWQEVGEGGFATDAAQNAFSVISGICPSEFVA